MGKRKIPVVDKADALKQILAEEGLERFGLICQEMATREATSAAAAAGKPLYTGTQPVLDWARRKSNSWIEVLEVLETGNFDALTAKDLHVPAPPSTENEEAEEEEWTL